MGRGFTRVPCKMTNFCYRLIEYDWPHFTTLNLTSLSHLIFCEAFNNTLRARLGRFPSQCQPSMPGLKDLSKPTTLFRSKFYCLEEVKGLIPNCESSSKFNRSSLISHIQSTLSVIFKVPCRSYWIDWKLLQRQT